MIYFIRLILVKLDKWQISLMTVPRSWCRQLNHISLYTGCLKCSLKAVLHQHQTHKTTLRMFCPVSYLLAPTKFFILVFIIILFPSPISNVLFFLYSLYIASLSSFWDKVEINRWKSAHTDTEWWPSPTRTEKQARQPLAERL